MGADVVRYSSGFAQGPGASKPGRTAHLIFGVLDGAAWLPRRPGLVFAMLGFGFSGCPQTEAEWLLVDPGGEM